MKGLRKILRVSWINQSIYCYMAARRLDRVSRKYSLVINVDKTKVMASDGISCRIGLLIQNEPLEQVWILSHKLGP